MAYAFRWRNCKGCRKWFYARSPNHGDVWCMTCRIGRAENAARDMAHKSGPYYDRWLNSRGPQGRPPTI